MAWQIPLSKSTTLQTIENLGTDSLFVSQGVTLASEQFVVTQFLGGANRQIVVHGTIVGAQDGLFCGNGGEANLQITVGATGRVTSLSLHAISIWSAGAQIDNAGVIEAFGSTALRLEPVSSTQHRVNNTGLIEGRVHGIWLDELGANPSAGGSVVVVNSGRIAGGQASFRDEIDGGSTDTITNRGTMDGDVLLGRGHDLLDSRSGVVRGTVWGGDGSDRLWTGSGVQSLFGDAGADELMGGAGADQLFGGSENDTASYASAAAGVKASLALPATNTGEAAGDLYVSIERLVGSRFADTLVGNGVANRLAGGAGLDSLTGGAGADQFVFTTAPTGSGFADRITDFVADLDEIRIENAVFAGLVAGNLPEKAFRANGTGVAEDPDDRVIYETDTGWLRFDRDGAPGPAAGIIFARVGTGLALGADDFVVI